MTIYQCVGICVFILVVVWLLAYKPNLDKDYPDWRG